MYDTVMYAYQVWYSKYQGVYTYITYMTTCISVQLAVPWY